jgi:hypothetical protein
MTPRVGVKTTLNEARQGLLFPSRKPNSLT